MKRIELIGVNKSFKEERVLKDICLTLGDNKTVNFIVNQYVQHFLVLELLLLAS